MNIELGWSNLAILCWATSTSVSQVTELFAGPLHLAEPEQCTMNKMSLWNRGESNMKYVVPGCIVCVQQFMKFSLARPHSLSFASLSTYLRVQGRRGCQKKERKYDRMRPKKRAAWTAVNQKWKNLGLLDSPQVSERSAEFNHWFRKKEWEKILFRLTRWHIGWLILSCLKILDEEKRIYTLHKKTEETRNKSRKGDGGEKVKLPMVWEDW